MSSTTSTAAREARRKRSRERTAQEQRGAALIAAGRDASFTLAADAVRRRERALAGQFVILCEACGEPVPASRPRAGVLCAACSHPAARRSRERRDADALAGSLL